MNKIYKVMYSKVKQCAVVVSEIAKSHGRHTKSSVAKSSAALTAGVLIALGSFSFVGMPVAQAADGTESLKNNDYVGANGYYWYFDEKKNQWTKYPYKISSLNNNRSWKELPNYEGGGAKEPGAVTAGLYAQAGEQTVTIGNRNAGQSKGSVFIGELDGYNDGRKNDPVGMSNNYVTAVGFQSNATGWGSIAIGSNAVAKNTKETSQVVDYEGNEGTSGTVQDDNYGIKLKPPITWSSVALGYSAQAKDGNIAIGAYSDATDTSSATPYVSVGSSNLQRRITNVADGTGDTDVATVGQMNKAIGSIGTTGWNLSTNGNSSSTTITSGKTVDFSPAVDGKNGTTDHKNVEISNDGSKVKISLNKNIVLGEATNGNGGSLNVYSDSTEASNLGNRVSIDGSTVSVNYGKEDGTSGTKRGVVLGVGEDYNNNAQGYIAFNNIDAKGTIGSTYLHSATDAPNDLKGRLVYSNAIDGTEYIANLDDGITFTGDVQKDVPEDYTQTPTKLNTTLNITGGAATEKDLTEGNIGVVSTPAAESADGTTQASKLEIKLNKDLKGITSITSQTIDGTTSGATITLGTNGTTISGGDVNVSTHKITGLKDGAADTDAATVGQMKTAIGDAKTKYYSVQEGLQSGGFSTNENNDGASSALAGLAAGYETGTTGIASTVVGSYSGVIGSSWLQGAAAVSVGTVNVNSNTDTSKPHSGVANSIVGQANTTTNSNAAIIYGAGNTVTDSYRPIDPTKVGAILGSVSDPKELSKAMQAAVKDSGGQVMVMGGGNTVDKAYMTQVVGVGNTVTGSTSEYNENTSNTSTQLNYVDGFYNTIEIGKNNYVIGSHNTLTGSSVDTNKSNLVLGDNHKLTNQKNNVILGSADDEQETKASEAVVIGHNADVTVDGGVAIGNGSVSTATDEANAEGYDPVSTNTNKASTNDSATWKATTGAVSIGGVNGNTTTTRRITNLAAGFNDTDAVNVAQIKKLASINASNIGANLQYGADGTTEATDIDKTENKKAWATAIGTGTVTKDDDGSKQMVTGKTVYDALHGGLDNITVGKDGQNGKDGSIGIAGQNGKDGYTMTIIKTEQGAAGVDGKDGKDGITRVIYQDKDGSKKHTIATLDDGLKFKGDNSTVITKKLDEQLNIIGGASTELTESNIGVNSTTDGSLKIQLAKDLTSITSISGSTDDKGAKITLDTTDKNISLNGGSIKDVASNLTKDGKIINGSDNNAASISDVQTLVQQGVDNGYTNGNGITIQKDGTSNVISVNKGDGLTFDNGKLAVNTGDGLTVDETTKALKIKTSDSNLKVDQNGIGLNNVITIGTAGTAGTNAHPITIDGTKGEVSGLNNTSWDSTADYSESTKAATESQVAAAVKDAIKQAGDNDIHVAAGSYAVNDQNQVSMNLVDKNNDTKGTVIITDVAKSSEMGDVSKLADGVKNAGGKTTTVVDAINNVNTSMNTKIGDQKYSTSNTSGSNKYVQDGDSITSAIGKLAGAVQQATTAAGQHSTVSAGSNITVTPAKQTDGHTDYQVALNKDITVDSVTAKTATTDTLTVKNSATIGGVTIANKTISGLDDTKIEKGSTNAVNAGTIWNELRPSGGTYINQNNTTAQNIMNLDTQVKKNSDLVNSDGSTIKIGGKDSATKVDISDKNGSGRVVTGVVSDANDPTSAANVGYVNGVTSANTQQIYRDMNNAYGRLNNNINKAAAGSNALAALHPLDYDPDDKADFAVGYGHYRNANAAAVGAFYHPNENTMVNVGVSLGNGDPGFNAGVSFKVGRGSAGREAMSRTEMAKVINSQSKEIDALKKDNADKDKRIDALEQKMAEILAKLDKNGK